MRLRGLVAVELAKDGLRVPAGWTVRLTPDGTLCVHDPADDWGNPHGRVRAGIRIDHADRMPDAALIGPMTIQARSALRRGRTVPERRRSDTGSGRATGWCMLTHPVALAILRNAGFPADTTPPRRNGAFDRLRQTADPMVVTTTHDQDLLLVSADLHMTAGGISLQAHLESKPGLTTLAVALPLPESAMTALHGHPLSRLIDARCGDERIDTALAGVRIARVESGRGSPNPVQSAAVPHVVVTMEPALWISWDVPPDDVMRLVELSPERH